MSMMSTRCGIESQEDLFDREPVSCELVRVVPDVSDVIDGQQHLPALRHIRKAESLCGNPKTMVGRSGK